jgi:hypothetical protein
LLADFKRLLVESLRDVRQVDSHLENDLHESLYRLSAHLCYPPDASETAL